MATDGYCPSRPWDWTHWTEWQRPGNEASYQYHCLQYGTRNELRFPGVDQHDQEAVNEPHPQNRSTCSTRRRNIV